jgi:diacylglycerol kinase family enzyme
MYYYIFEPPQGPKEFERTAQIKSYLSELGIAGEMAAPQPGKTVEDLVQVALSKRYSTVVAVGGMEFINRIARALISYEAVLGIIPVTNDADVAELIGTSDWKIAAEQLKRRRWQHIQLGSMNGNVCFLTPASIQVPVGETVTLTTEDFSIQAAGPQQIKITPLRDPESPVSGLLLDITGESKAKKGLLSLFKPQNTVPLTSHFTVKKLSVLTDKAQAVVVAGETLASTPVDCSTEAKGIRIIIAKGTGTI